MENVFFLILAAIIGGGIYLVTRKSKKSTKGGSGNAGNGEVKDQDRHDGGKVKKD